MATAVKLKKNPWQEALLDLITDSETLLKMLELRVEDLQVSRQAALQFPLKVTKSFVARMQKGNPHDPLLLQVLAQPAELLDVSGYERDPLGEARVNQVPGLLHKYHGRVLLTLANACAIHCRYCFRRYFPYEENNPGRQGWENIFAYIKNDVTITEVILSGGDPLMLSDHLLQQFSDKLLQISHVKRLRIHTRLPIVLPLRITKALLTWLSALPIPVAIVVHVNHAQELNYEVHDALQALRQAGATLLNQSVLLRGVNDDAGTLIDLSERLYTVGVLPYYLHLPDKVKGTAHFDLDWQEAKNLYQKMVATLPGYLLPKLVFEQAGQPAKTFLSTELFTE